MTDATTTTTAQHWLLQKYSRSRSLLDTMAAGGPALSLSSRGDHDQVAGQGTDQVIQWDH